MATLKREGALDKALSFLGDALGLQRAVVVDVRREDGHPAMHPAAARGIPLASAWQEIDTELCDLVFSSRQPAARDGKICVPVLSHGGQLGALLYGEGAGADALEKATAFARTLDMEAHAPNGGMAAGTVVANRYRVDERMMAGRFSTLYRARDEATGANLVLRHLEEPLGNRDARLQTLREGRTLHRLRHRNLPRVLDVVEDSGHVHLVLEDIVGKSLQERVEAEGPVGPELVRRYLKQLMSVLDYLHQQSPPIVHRDLRPDTVLVSRHGVLKVAEFGLAKMEAAAAGGQTAFRAHGHPGYAAPEQLLGDQSHPRNDLYSAGALAYYMATGTAPPDSLQRFSAGVALPPIHEKQPDFPRDLEELIAWLMSSDAARRPQSVQEVMARLEPPAEKPQEELAMPELVAEPEPEAEHPKADDSAKKSSMWKLMFGKKKKEDAVIQASPMSATQGAVRAPMVDLAQIELDREVGRLLPEAVSKSIGGVCIGQISPTEITVAVKDPSDVHVYDNVSVGTRGLFVPTVVGADPGMIEHAQEYIYKGEKHGDTSWLKFLDLKRLHDQELVLTSSAAQVGFNDEAVAGPIVAMVDRLIKEAIAAGASDLHLEPYDTGMELRYRIDGVLRKVAQFTPENAHAVVKRLKVLGNLDVAQNRITQGGRISLKVGGKEYDLRVSLIPVPAGESVVMRVLKKGAFTLQLSDLGFDPEREEAFRHVLSQPYGMILVCGPTGSGKSTTLYASLKEIARPDRKLLTVEDPIEYQMPGIMQVQVNIAPREPENRVTFSKALREFLRQDPDVILVGEMRDPETAHIGIQAALTGHLLLSTIHTNDSIGIVARLMDMGCEPFLIGSTLLGGLAQRLARRICEGCKEEVPVTPDARELFEREGIPNPRMFEGKGCQACHGTGARGRVGLYELLQVTPEIRALINDSALEQELRKAALAQGFETLLHDGLSKVAQGRVTMDEVLRVCKTL